MAPSATLARDSPASRWFRRSAPLWILLGIALLAAMPGVLKGPNDRDSAAQNPQTRPAGAFALPDEADPHPRQTSASGTAR